MPVPIDRRLLLQWASAAVPMAALGTVAKAQSLRETTTPVEHASAPAPADISLRLAKFVADTPFEALPQDVIEMTKRALLDAVGVSIGASTLEPACQAYIELALESAGVEQSSIFGTGRRVPMAAAALANGALAHALDYEDSHEASRTHPNAATVAAALAVAEALNVSGKELIAAVALGCDVVCRLALAQIEDSDSKRAFYRPAIVGTFGATSAAARLLKLTAEQTLSAFSIALCQNSCSGEILNSPDSHIRAVRDGMCAQAGVTAALLARKGIQGFSQPFEGNSGFFAMYWGGGFRAQELTEGLGRHFAIGDVAFKPWPSCRDTHLYIQAALELSKRQTIDIDAIARIVAPVAKRNLIICEPAASKKAPRTSIDAKFSLYYTVAHALAHRQIVLSSFSKTARAEPRVLECAAKVSYRLDPEAARAVVEGGGDVLEIVMKDGTVHRQRVQALAGSIQSPMSRPQLIEKFVDCGLQTGRHDRAGLQTLSRQILDIDAAPNVASIVGKV